MRPFFSDGWRILPVIAPLLSLALSAELSLAQQHEVLNEEVITKWKEYESFSRRLQGKSERNTKSIATGKQSGYTSIYKQNPQCAMLISPLGDSTFDYCMLSNASYTAQLKRRQSDPKRCLLDFVEINPNAVPPGTNVSVKTLLFLVTAPQFGYCESKIVDIVSSPSYKIRSVQNVDMDGRQLVRVDHSYVYDKSKGPTVESKRLGSIYFDPARNWCIRLITDKEEFFRSGVRQHVTDWRIENDVVDHESGFPIIKRQVMSTRSFIDRTGKTQGADITIDYDLRVDGGPGNSEFTLSAFDLPEPSGAPRGQARPAYLWILGIAIGFGALALLFRHLAKRHTTTDGRGT